MSDNWRDTLFVWDGILSLDDDDDGKEGRIGLKWEGKWVGCDSADAAAVETPKRGAFDRDVASANTFAVSGTASPKKDSATEDSLYCVSMIEGGYDLGEGDDVLKLAGKQDDYNIYNNGNGIDVAKHPTEKGVVTIT